MLFHLGNFSGFVNISEDSCNKSKAKWDTLYIPNLGTLPRLETIRKFPGGGGGGGSA